jgi:uncharacterized protein YndB with AHSA1/START domain
MSTNDRDASTVLRAERVVPFLPREVFTAFEQPEHLAQWWGPAGFTNTFEVCEFTPGGRWVFVMHGPNGIDYPNECRFRQIETDARVVIEHVCEPHFTLTIELAPRPEGTHLSWSQEFDDPTVADRVRAICEMANEQNLDRLESVLKRLSS